MGVAINLTEESQTLVAEEKHISNVFEEKLLEAAKMRSISFKGRGLLRDRARSVSFNGRDLEKNVSGSSFFKGRKREGRFLRSISYKVSLTETTSLESIRFEGMDSPTSSRRSSFRARNSETAMTKLYSSMEKNFDSSSLRSSSFKEEAAALKLQKVYKSYRTRRNLADCAVVAEELWWQAIDFVMLKQNTVSFFDIEKPETAVSRWSRARIKAAKVGKGLSKDDKARKLAFQHWLEAIDPRHRYGHNLHFYYDTWFESDTVQPFFYWLDVGDGRDLNLDRCSRAKLQQQCIKYLGPKEREQYEVVVVDGKLLYMLSGDLVDTSKGSKGTKWIFVLSTLKKLYVGQKKKGTFQHSSFLAGGATSAAGRLVVDEGVIRSIWPYSGHYLPTEENFNAVISFLEENNIDLTNVQKTTADEDELSVHLGKNLMIGSEPNSEAEREERQLVEKQGKMDSQKEFTGTNTVLEETEANTAFWPSESNETGERCSRLTPHQSVDSIDEEAIAKKIDKSMHLKEELAVVERESNTEQEDETASCQYQEQVSYKRSMSDKNLEEIRTEMPHKLLQRLQSKKSLESYKLGKQLSFKWSTGAGPRIACIADYPSELRVKALEKVNLSPRCNNSPREFPHLSRHPMSPRI